MHVSALFNPETSILIQKRHPYTGYLNSETLGDSINVFLHCGDVLVSATHSEEFMLHQMILKIRTQHQHRP